ncbi:hypothetical protein Nepgr_028548 [Nepenthes gracilis]|uniref:Uncharacterized protein n=1 Tax=Nepenthes gracilis TaxID=150966 RepID=A0AAD3TAJ6_NEPGR|nr:hypothetical protein Nepgr_028548 [Nepenthes gracilis]
MDALELAIPTAVAVPKLLASEGFAGARVAVSDSQACESDRVSVFGGSKIEKCSAFNCHRVVNILVDSLLLLPCHLHMKNRIFRSAGAYHYYMSSAELRLLKEGMLLELNHGGMSNPKMLLPVSEEKELQPKAGKAPRSGNGCFKRPQMPHVENLMAQAEHDNMRAASEKFGSLAVNFSNAAKMKNNLNSKRGDRRNSKVLLKAKCNAFSLKAGLGCFNAAVGMNNAFGMYGLKSDVHDVTKLVDDISLNDLLDGSYEFPTFGKDKGRKAANVNVNILHLVRNALSVLQVQGTMKGKQPNKVDIGANEKGPSLPSTCSSYVASGINGDEENHHFPDLSSCKKVHESHIETEALADSSVIPLCKPHDILDQLLLPPCKDLESLLQEAAKPLSASSRSASPHSGKTMPHPHSLPPFHWSNNYNGHWKSNFEASSSKSSRSSCHGRWVRIRSNSSSFFGGSIECFTSFGLLTYDHSLVPSGRLKYSLPEMASSAFVILPACERGSTSAIRTAVSQSPTESGSSVDCKVLDALQTPRLLAAAQTLCDIANRCSKNNLNGITNWPKTPWQKGMKAQKFRSSKKSESLPAVRSEIMLDGAVGTMGRITPSKKPKLSTTEKKEDFVHGNAVRGPNYCPVMENRNRGGKILSRRFCEIASS